MKKTTLSFVFACLVGTVFGQFFNISQMEANPIRLNPALTGEAKGGRLLANYLFRTGLDNASTAIHYFSYDHPLQLKSGDKIGVGLQIFYERLTNDAIRSDDKYAKFSGAYHRKLFKNTKTPDYLILGGAIGVRQATFGTSGNDMEDVLFDFGVGYNITLDEHTMQFGMSYIDGEIGSDGFSLFSNFWQWYGFADLRLFERWHLLPHLRYADYSFSINEWLLGTRVGYVLSPKGNHRIMVGTGYRSVGEQDDWYVNLGFETPQMTISIGNAVFFNGLLGDSLVDLAFQYRFN